MVIDHVGYIFFPEHIILRIVGRLTMPIMTFFAAEGIRKTRDPKRYLLRLLIFAALSELPYRLAFDLQPKEAYYPSNVLFTLLLGVLAVIMANRLEEKFKKPVLRLLPYVLCMGLAQFLYTDWNWLGVIMIIGFYHAEQNKLKQFLYLAISYFLYIAAEWIAAWLNGTLALGLWSPVHAFGIAAIALIFLYNGKRGCSRNWGYLFYLFYPAHLLILYLIKLFI